MCSENKGGLKNLAVYIVFSRWSSVGEETTWGGRLFQTCIVQGKKKIGKGHFTGLVEYTSTDGTLVFVWWIGSATSARVPPLLYTLFCTLCVVSYYCDRQQGIPSRGGCHLANTAGVMPAIADIPCSTSLHHFHIFDIIRCMWAPNCRGIFQVRSD